MKQVREPVGRDGGLPPEERHRRMVVWSWLIAYIIGTGAAFGSASISVQGFFAAIGLPPILLFAGLSIFGNLRANGRRFFAYLWTIGAAAVFTTVLWPV